MPNEVAGLLVGAVFGAGLFLSGLADPDKIVGTLRLKDFHALRTIAVFLLVGMFGTWVLGMAGAAHYSVKPALIYPVLLGGALLGMGFGMTGYCPGTGLACAAAGRLDAWVTLIGMLAGALVYIVIYPHVVPGMESAADFGAVTIPRATGTDPAGWVLPITLAGAGLLWLTRPRTARRDRPAEAGGQA